MNILKYTDASPSLCMSCILCSDSSVKCYCKMFKAKFLLVIISSFSHSFPLPPFTPFVFTWAQLYTGLWWYRESTCSLTPQAWKPLHNHYVIYNTSVFLLTLSGCLLTVTYFKICILHLKKEEEKINKCLGWGLVLGSTV